MKTDSIERFILTSDWHFGCHSNQKRWLRYLEDYFYNQFIPWLKEHADPKRDVVVMLGDVYENRQSIDQEVDDAAFKVIDEISKILPIWILVGNHDIYRKATNEINALSNKLKYNPNVEVFKDPEVVKIKDKDCLMLPWCNTTDQEREILTKYKDVDYVFCHSDFKGVRYNRFVKIEEGIEIESEYNFKRVFSGHIHLRQRLHDDGLIFVGSPYQLTRNDINNEKGHWTFDLHTEDIQFFQNDTSPKFKKIDFREVTNDYTRTLKELIPIFNRNFIDLYIDNRLLSETETFDVIQFLSKYSETLEPIFYSKEGFSLEESVEMDNFNFGETLDLMSIFNHQIDAMEFPDKLKTKIKTYIHSLYEKVQKEII